MNNLQEQAATLFREVIYPELDRRLSAVRPKLKDYEAALILSQIKAECIAALSADGHTGGLAKAAEWAWNYKRTDGTPRNWRYVRGFKPVTLA